MTNPARRLRDALEPIAALSFYSDPCTRAYSSLGLDDFLPAYVWSRSSVLGVADPAVVAAAFGVWEPGLIRTNLEIARAACSVEQIRGATQDAAGAAARDVLAGVEVGKVGGVVAGLRRGIAAVDLMGRPLVAGHRAWTWPTDAYAGLWRAATAWRELRGDSHVAACVAGGIDGVQANVLNELDAGYELGEYTSTRNWSGDDIGAAADALTRRGLVRDGALTDDGRAFREQLEVWTDTAVAAAVAALGPDLDAVVEQTSAWARSIVERGWFPDDQRKRDAG